MGISRSFRWLTTVLCFALLLGVLPASGSAAPATQTTTTLPDLGDAPDSTNAMGAAMQAYPGVPASFPTSLQPAGVPPGPRHINSGLVYFLGNSISREAQAEQGSDQDGINNIRPPADVADNDDADDGLILPDKLPHCTRVQLRYRVNVTKLVTGPVKAYVNLWSDWNRDGSWSPVTTLACPGAGPALEWSVQNHQIVLPGPGSYILVTPPVMVSNKQPDMNMWLRFSVSNALAPNFDGRGPAGGYAKGETEDYRLEGQPLPPIIPPNPSISPVVLTGQPPVPREPGLAVPDGKLKEVDVVHIGGSSGGPKSSLIVAAVGTGATVRLSSWRAPFGAAQPPQHLHDSPNIVGYDVKLYALTPDVSPDLTYSLFISAVRDPQQNLWLAVWRLNDDGTFVALGKRGYGSNANVDVLAYAIAHRPILRADQTISRFQVVTPIVTAAGSMRLISWTVNAATGAINGQQDSGNWGNPATGTTVDATRLMGNSWTGQYYTVSYRNRSGNLATNFWEVTTAGTPIPRGSGASGVDIRGDNSVTVAVQDLAIAPLTPTGFVSAHARNSEMRLTSWDNQRVFCSDIGCTLSPHRVAHSGMDLNPGTGIGLGLPAIASQRALLVDALGATDLDDTDTLFQKGNLTPQGVASIRKVMVLVIALEAVADGEVALNDLVEVSETAASHPGSSMGLEAGEIQSLRNLLHGMMMVSGGDATQAIIEYVGAQIGGDATTFVDRMAAKATELGMNASQYCGTGGYCYSTTEDQVALWLAASKTPLFFEFAGKEQHDACGETPTNPNKCYFLVKNVSQLYPGVEGHKTGGGGFDCNGGTSNSTPRCASQGCLSIQATRLSRTLVLNELHPNNAGTGADRWNDAYRLFDYGFQRLFTPDFRGNSGAQGGAATDFAMDNIGDTQFVSAVLTPAGALKVCSWQVVAGIGQIGLLGCVEKKYSGMPGGAQQVVPNRIDILRLSTLESEGDYLSGHLEAGNLVLRAWRVAERP